MSGEFNGVILLGILWFLLSLMTRGRSKSPRTPQSPPLSPPRPKPLPGRPDATQREGLRLETVLRDLQRSLEEAARPAGASSPVARRKVDVPEALELEPEARSLEEEVRREVRRPVDLDDEGAEVEARRIQAAEARDVVAGGRQRPLMIEPNIQVTPADHTATRGYSAQQLRDAIVWREILGPPVSER